MRSRTARHGFVGDAQAVRSHVGDEPHRPRPVHVDAFVKFLSDLHGLLAREPKPDHTLLLEAAGLERRLGPVKLLGRINLGYTIGGCLKRVSHRVSLGLGFGPELRPVVFGQGRLEPLGELRRSMRTHVGGDFPVLLGDEILDLAFPVGDEPDCDGLHPPGAQVPRADFFPEKRAQLVAHHAVQKAPGLLSVDHVHVDRTGLGERFLDRAVGDFVESHPPNAVLVQAQGLLQMPGDGFAFPVRVGRQVDQTGARGGALQIADRVFLRRHHLIGRLVALGDLDAQLPSSAGHAHAPCSP